MNSPGLEPDRQAVIRVDRLVGRRRFSHRLDLPKTVDDRLTRPFRQKQWRLLFRRLSHGQLRHAWV
jgi:hypothetical protein